MTEALALLGLTPEASQDETKKAYRQRMKECHPDLHPNDPEANQKAVMLTRTYEILTKPQPEPVRIIYQRPTVVVRFFNSGNGYFYGNTTTTGGYR